MKRKLFFAMVFLLLIGGNKSMAEMIQGTDTLNQGREKINDAIAQSEQALNIANNASGIANNASGIANEAKSNSENTQEQLNQIVIDGDSSVEAAQARVNADGFAFDVLKERLDNNDSLVQSNVLDRTKQIKSSVLYEAALKDIEINYNLPNCRKAIKKGVLRVAIVGDSITEGANNLLTDVWAVKFINKLKKNLSGVTIEYTNFALGGRTMTQFMDDAYIATNPETDFTLNFWRSWSTAGKSWKDHVKDYGADLVIFAFGMNDTAETDGDKNFYTNLTGAISYIKANNPNTDICLVSTILPASDSPYAQSLPETLNLARVTRELAKNNNYALIDTCRLWEILVRGYDDCRFNAKSFSTIADINLQKVYNFEFTATFLSATYPTTAQSCDMNFRNYNNNYLFLRFHNDGSGNYIDLYRSNSSGTLDFVWQWSNCPQTVTVNVDGAVITVNGEQYIFYEKLYTGSITMLAITSYIGSIAFTNKTSFSEKNVYTETELLGTITEPFGQGIEGNGVNHPNSLGHYLAYYMASIPIIKTISKNEISTMMQPILDLDSINPTIHSIIYSSFGAHTSKPNEHNLIVETFPLGNAGAALQIAKDYDVDNAGTFTYSRKNVNGVYDTTWIAR